MWTFGRFIMIGFRVGYKLGKDLPLLIRRRIGYYPRDKHY